MQEHMTILGVNDWWAAYVRRFALRASQDPLVYLSQVIQPVTNVDRLLDRVRLVTYGTAIAGNGFVNIGTVPDGKRWQVFAYQILASSGGDFQRQFQIQTPAGTGHSFEAPADESGITYNPQAGGFPMDSGWRMGLAVTGWVSSGSWGGMSVLLQESDAWDDRTPLPAVL